MRNSVRISRSVSWLVSAALLAGLAVMAALVLPAAAQATLAYVKQPLHPVVYVANDNGSGSRKVGSGSGPRVSPDGKTVAFLREGPGSASNLMIAPAAGGTPRVLIKDWRDTFNLAFSPDSKTVAVLRGSELGKRRLVLIDLGGGGERVLANGYFGGFSFSPDGEQLVYSQGASENYPAPTDLYRVATSGGGKVRLTKDRNSLDPLWGPSETIVFVKQLGAKKRKYGPKNELFTIRPNGKGVKRLTTTKVEPLLQGLYPTEWSANGSRLLAEFEGQDTSYAVTVNPRTGAQRAIDKRNQGESGFVGTAISRDGSTVLGYTGGFDPGVAHDVVTHPYAGGGKRTLVENAFDPDWSR